MSHLTLHTQLYANLSHTNTRRLFVVDRPPGVTKCTFRSTVYRAIAANLRRAIFACAQICYNITARARTVIIGVSAAPRIH